MSTSQKIKNSLILGSLTSTFGIFITKILGLIYISPLTSFAGGQNMSYYTDGYIYYDFLLKITSAGIPFAIASLVAKYTTLNDLKTSYWVRKIGVSFTLVLTLSASLIFLFLINPLAVQILGDSASVNDVNKLKNVFYILLLAVISVPYLGAIRGYYQGLKQMQLYAKTNVLEQLVRVFIIVVGGFFFVRVLSFDTIYAVYVAISAAGFGAIISIVYIRRSTSKQLKEAKLHALEDRDTIINKKDILFDILKIGIPYFLMTILAGISPLINSTFYKAYVTSLGQPLDTAMIEFGIAQTNLSKLISIPQVLSLGFSSSLVAFLSETIACKNYEKMKNQIIQSLETVLLILIPILTVFFFFSKEVYFVFYGNRNLEVATYIFKNDIIFALVETLTPIMATIMITIGERKKTLIILFISSLIKYFTFFPLVKYFGIVGMINSTVVRSIFDLVCYFVVLKNKYNITIFKTLYTTLKLTICSMIAILPCLILNMFNNLGFIGYSSRIFYILLMGIYGVIIVSLYAILIIKFNIAQSIFNKPNLTIKSLIHMFKRKIFKN